MEVKIGVTDVARELTIDAEIDADEIEQLVRKALDEGGVLSLTDAKGRRVVVPVERLGYVDISHSVTGQVGFRG